MRIYKFGGSSLATADAIKHVASLVATAAPNDDLHVVVSAIGDVTDQLLELGALAMRPDRESWEPSFERLRKRHLDVLREAAGPDGHTEKGCRDTLDELRDVLTGVSLIRELTPRTRDVIQSFGERLSAQIVAEVLRQHGVESNYLDARTFIQTDDRFSLARVDLASTRKLLTEQISRDDGVQVITGFIGATSAGETTTLGRGGSDYTAAIVGSLLDADEVIIWTDVDGVLTADPTKVRRAFPIAEMTYEEAMEISHFGAKVIYPPTILPLMQADIPILIKNTFSPEHPGTRITSEGGNQEMAVTGLSSIDEVAVVRIQGSGMVGVTGTSSRIFGALAQHNINVILISQASSEHSVCLAVAPDDAQRAEETLKAEFRDELEREMVSEITVESGFTTLAVVGKNMRLTPGVAGKMFGTLGKNGINVIAIAQGSSELNISAIIDQKNETKALAALHDAFFLSGYKTIHLFQVGLGNIGSMLLEKIRRQSDVLRREGNVELRLVGMANREQMYIDAQGIPLESWPEHLEAEGTATDLDAFVDQMRELNLPNSIFVDATASGSLPDRYLEIIQNSISIVTPNKKANARDMSYYREIRKQALRYNTQFLYETNVGAGLPIIETMRHMVMGGDRVQSIEAVLSGTLSYIFNVYDGTVPFSEVVRIAQDRGFTEPDPRDDLNGMDVARKLLILARESGFELELEDIEVQNLVPEDARDADSVEDFYDALSTYDDDFQKTFERAQKEGNELRYVARFKDGEAYTRLESAGPDHPFFNMEDTDNMVVLTTDEYEARPLVIQGAGAGREVTAAGVLSDILKIARYGE